MAFAVNQQMALLTTENLLSWLKSRHVQDPSIVGVLNAGNIPLVGLQDWLAVVLTGHAYRGVVSSKSPALLPAFVSSVKRRCPAVDSALVSADELWSTADIVIATGNDATKAWCSQIASEHGISRSHCLLRGHRYSVAILDGQENAADCEGLAEDALLHEGTGCRSVALIFAPSTLAPDRYLEHFAQFSAVFPPHPDTPGGLAMAKAFLQAVDMPHAYGDGLEFLVSRGEAAVQGPGHVRWVPYEDLQEAERYVNRHIDAIQCVAARQRLQSELPDHWPSVNLGDTQRPELNWYPDGIDTVDFLVGLA